MITIHQPQKLSSEKYRAAEDYREKAEECRRIARQISLVDDRISILNMADRWDHLADEAEKMLQ